METKMAYVWTPDPPQQGYPTNYPQQYPQPIILQAPPGMSRGSPSKPGKLSAKKIAKIAKDWNDLLKSVEEAKSKDKKEDKKKKDGLNWVELSLCLIVASIPIAVVEFGFIIAIARVIPILK